MKSSITQIILVDEQGSVMTVDADYVMGSLEGRLDFLIPPASKKMLDDIIVKFFEDTMYEKL